VSDEPRGFERVEDYYAVFDEARRLEGGHGRLELERTFEILRRHLPPPPATLLDVGGAAGRYAFPLARAGYRVHLLDASPRLVEQAARASSRAPAGRLASARVADARDLPFEDESVDALLLLGPLYHLTVEADRVAALAEGRRVLRPDAPLFGAAISRFASAFDGLRRGLIRDPEFRDILRQDLADGQHRNPTGRIDYFTRAYFHRPEELRREVEHAGLEHRATLAVEGLGALMVDLEHCWDDPSMRAALLETIRVTESEPTLLGASPHLLVVAERR
jgi:ubiquinone/menaquinone biosynthesis C-methylase UbiE